jgi:CRISPR-associated endonuclease/helicase Cas3
MTSEYARWFEKLTTHAPWAWQSALGDETAPRSRVIKIPTGYGKTLGVLLAWLYYRVHCRDERWPRRLVWTLPMRVLVEQTADVVRRECLAPLGVLWEPGTDHAGKVGVHLLMGGADSGADWNLHPEACAVFIGTQDMLLSRALNRGYAAGRARWPLEFGLLNHDSLWVLDEVQLMDVGLATTAQLQAFFDDDAQKGLGTRPRLSWWMSATLQPSWLESVDTVAQHPGWVEQPVKLALAERTSGLASIRKSLVIGELPGDNASEFAARCATAHRALEDGEFGRITLVVCNTVKRACATYDALKKLNIATELELVHGRFRPYERARWKGRFLERSSCKPGVDRILVATQVVEAGVDISAGCVVTELAPWSSLVQRFGRCARYGGRGSVVVIDRGRDEKTAAPYTPEDLDGALMALQQLAGSTADVGISSIEAYEEGLSVASRAELYPYRPEHLLIRRELDELFDTTPDLTGADLDVSRYIRSGEERDLSVFWVELAQAKKSARPSAPPSDRRPMRDELCGVPFLAAQEWLCGKATKTDRKPRLRSGVRAWIWDWIDGQWTEAKRADLTPGKIVCVASEVGGYRAERGFDPTSSVQVSMVPVTLLDDAQVADDLEDSEKLSAAHYKTIATHGREVGELAERIALEIGLEPRLRALLVLAGRWHDYGKAHGVFQGKIRADARPDREDLAKAPDGAWRKGYRTADNRESRAGFRHELASCMALFDVLRRYEPTHPALLGPWLEALALMGQGESPRPAADRASATSLERAILECTAEEFDLVAYLVLCHHGKVRASLHAGPKDQDYVDRDGRGLPIRGVREGDVLPAIELEPGERLPELCLTLTPAVLGLSQVTGRSWRDRTLALMKRHGPGELAWLEALLIAADRRASKLATDDSLLEKEAVAQ